jgi:hypothetical protein
MLLQHELRMLRRRENVDDEVLRSKNQALTDLLVRFTEVTGGKVFCESDNDKATAFIDDYYFCLDKPSPTAETLSAFFAQNCTFSVVGAGSCDGQNTVVETILVNYDIKSILLDNMSIDGITFDVFQNMFKGLQVRHSAVSVSTDRLDSLQKMLFVMCNCKIQVCHAPELSAGCMR